MEIGKRPEFQVTKVTAKEYHEVVLTATPADWFLTREGKKKAPETETSYSCKRKAGGSLNLEITRPAQKAPGNSKFWNSERQMVVRLQPGCS